MIEGSGAGTGSVPIDDRIREDQKYPDLPQYSVVLWMSSEPTVTISVKKDNNDKEKEKVLFTLVNGQVENNGVIYVYLHHNFKDTITPIVDM